MSRAFVRETEGGEAFEDLPDRQVSPHHLVTSSGLAQMDETKRAALQVECWLSQGLQKAMNQFNGVVHPADET